VYKRQESDHHAIQELVKSKYSGLEWNFAYSPGYEMHGKLEHAGRDILTHVSVARGRIVELRLTENGIPVLEEISGKLLHCLHHPETVSEELNKINFAPYDLPGRKILEGIF
jgi:hypothetical protein